MKSEVLEVDIGLLTAAHELKSPLSLLRQLALSLEFTENSTNITNQMVQISDRALSQIDDLLKVAHLENGLFNLEPVNPRAVCDSVIGANLNSRANIKVIFRNRRHLVIANSTLLRSIVSNFLENARKYGETTQLSISDYKSKVRISIRDRGPALPINIWRAINQNAISAPLPTPLRPGSSGLGLFISTRFAAHMNAEIEATRHHDGTSFHLDLPISGQLSLC